jgi:CheY-like chemotaxis protein
MLILYAEDEPNDIFFLNRAFKLARSPHILVCVADGEEAIQYLAGEEAFSDRAIHPLPALILLDINLPRKTGLEVLEWLRQQPHFKSLPVLIFTSSSRPEDMELARKLGADDYLLKTSDPSKLIEFVKYFDQRWLSGQAAPLV